MNNIYISGPVTGTEGYVEKFNDVAMMIADKHEGWDIINPVAINGLLPKGTTWKEYMKVSIALLEMCKSIYMMSGWEKSKGAKVELVYALLHGYDVYTQDDISREYISILEETVEAIKAAVGDNNQ